VGTGRGLVGLAVGDVERLAGRDAEGLARRTGAEDADEGELVARGASVAGPESTGRASASEDRTDAVPDDPAHPATGATGASATITASTAARIHPLSQRP